jgi:selenocysteine lyase/cysteine desulfurase
MIYTEVSLSKPSQLELYFNQFRQHIIGIDQEFESPFGNKKIIYTDWTASGRLYRPIEEKLCNEFGPFVANTHTETTVSGTAMTKAYHEAKHIIKNHVNCDEDDVLIVSGNGMTDVVNKFHNIQWFLMKFVLLFLLLIWSIILIKHLGWRQLPRLR